MAIELRERGGRLWQRLTGWQNSRTRGGGFPDGCGADAFRAFLAMPGKPLDSDVARALSRSPLIPNTASHGAAPQAVPCRKVLADGRERARDDLRRFLEEEVVLVGDEVWARCHGPLTMLPSTKPNGRYYVEPHGRGHWHIANPAARIDRVDELWGFTQRHLPHSLAAYGSAAVLDGGLPPGLSGFMDDDDVLLWAWDMPGDVLCQVAAMPPAERPDARDPAVAAALRGLQTWSMRGSLGAYGWDEVPALMDELEGLRAAAPAALGGRSPQSWDLRLHCAYLDEIARPRLLARRAAPDALAMDEADSDSLAGLAP